MPNRDEALAAFGRNVAKFRNERGFSQDKLPKKQAEQEILRSSANPESQDNLVTFLASERGEV